MTNPQSPDITFVDTHCHLDFERFDDDRDAVVERARAAGVTRIVVPAIDLDNCQAVLDLTDRYDGVYAAVGLHPTSTDKWKNRDLPRFYELAQHPNVVAIGEIGLDYYWNRTPRFTQLAAFTAQMELAAQLGLPVIIHNRDASADTIQMLRESPLAGRERPGVLHSFSAESTIAQQALDMGFYIGFTGPLTFKKAEDLRAVAAAVPLDRVLIETDAPFLAPQAHRGQRNEPAYVVEVAAKLAEIHGKTVAEIAAITSANAERLFGFAAKPALQA